MVPTAYSEEESASSASNQAKIDEISKFNVAANEARKTKYSKKHLKSFRDVISPPKNKFLAIDIPDDDY